MMYMPLPSQNPETVSDVIDRIETIREELLHLQRSLEKIEGESPRSAAGDRRSET